MSLNVSFLRIGAVAVAATLAACGPDATAPEEELGAALLSIQPTPGSMDVTVGAEVVVTFDHAIAEGMEAYAALHEGSVTGPIVEGTWMQSEDRTQLTFMPLSQLKPATTYVIHLGAGMMDDHGNHVDLETHGMGMGGAWATGSMMTGGMGSGMGQTGTMMGEGWAHPNNGTYGMLFTFTTAG